VLQAPSRLASLGQEGHEQNLEAIDPGQVPHVGNSFSHSSPRDRKSFREIFRDAPGMRCAQPYAVGRWLLPIVLLSLLASRSAWAHHSRWGQSESIFRGLRQALSRLSPLRRAPDVGKPARRTIHRTTTIRIRPRPSASRRSTGWIRPSSSGAGAPHWKACYRLGE
jgi:hypothetical protein